eukprot:7925-Heterococcus_DN1.PRE.2
MLRFRKAPCTPASDAKRRWRLRSHAISAVLRLRRSKRKCSGSFCINPPSQDYAGGVLLNAPLPLYGVNMAFGKRDDSSMQKEAQDTATVALSPCSERGVDDMSDSDQSAVSRVLSDPTLLAHCMQFQDGLMHREYWNGDHAAT